MGGTVLTQDQSDDLFWLGRYTERVYTTVRNFFPEFDAMIDEQMDSFGNIVCAWISRTCILPEKTS